MDYPSHAPPVMDRREAWANYEPAFNVLLEVGNAFRAEQSPKQDPQNSP
jgi:hypothetical protein